MKAETRRTTEKEEKAEETRGKTRGGEKRSLTKRGEKRVFRKKIRERKKNRLKKSFRPRPPGLRAFDPSLKRVAISSGSPSKEIMGDVHGDGGKDHDQKKA
jgi:hypothetical protein